MDELTTALAFSFGVTNDPNASTAPHPRYSHLYKHRGDVDRAQERRRTALLQNQKAKRFDYVSLARRLTGVVTEKVGEGDCGSEEEQMEVEEKARRPGKRYKDQLMLSEWMLEVPEDFVSEWTMVPCPVGRRNLIVASKGQTSSYAKNGYCMNRFPSLLPGGSKNMSCWNKDSTILDCVYSEVNRTYYVLDVMCWRSQPVYDSETEFRFYWLQAKFEEIPQILTVSKLNACRFEVLPNFACDSDTLQNILSSPMNIELDGLLFYHKRTHYAFGTTPLVLWLKAFMLPEILGVPVSTHHMEQRPTSYSTFSHHAEQVRTNAVTRKSKTPHGRSRSSDNIDIGVGGGVSDEGVAMDTGGQKSRRRRARRRNKAKSGSMEVETVENDTTVCKLDRDGTKSDGDDTEATLVAAALSPM